jgi:hypothetical protein
MRGPDRAIKARGLRADHSLEMLTRSRSRVLPRQREAAHRGDSAPSPRRPNLARSRFILLPPMAVLALLGPAAPAALRFPLGALAGALAAFFVLAQVRATGCAESRVDAG